MSHSSFQLLATRDAVSPAHMDRHGCVTTGHTETGDKLWIYWPTVSPDIKDLIDWGSSDMPPGKPSLMYLRAGDQFVQPAGTPHTVATGPFSPICHMTGQMLAPSQNIVRQMRVVSAESWSDSTLTNEEQAQEVVAWFNEVERLIKEAPDAFPWGGSEDEFQRVHKASIFP